MQTYTPLLSSLARTATVATGDQNTPDARGVVVVIDVTAASGSPSVVFTLQGKDSLSGQYYTIVASAAKTGIGTTVLRVYPGLTAASNLTVSDVLPSQWRVNCVHTGTDSITYTLGASYIL